MSGGLHLALAMVIVGLLLIAFGLLLGPVEAWITRRLAEHRLCRDVEAMWREIYRALDEADGLPRSARPFKRRRVAGVRLPRRPMGRPTSTSNSERH